MERININNLNQASKGTPDYSNNTWEKSRREVIKTQIMGFYISSRRPMPEPGVLEAEVDLAQIDWEEIPSEHLLDVCAQARKSSGAFLASNGSVVEVWRAIKAELRRPKNEFFIAPPKPPEPTEEEIAKTKEMFADLIKSLSRGY